MISDRIPVLLDTDPGNDIDDALAISYLLAQPRCELLGITTVTGDTAKRAAIAEVLCTAAGRPDIPIIAGRQGVLAHGRGQVEVAQYDPIAHLPHTLDRNADEAVDFLRKTIRSRPGEIVLLSIGPFSNVALLFAIDPEIPFLLKDFVSMAGAFSVSNNLEWNCLVDPVATAMVVKAPKPTQTWFGLDVTLQCALDQAECGSRFTGPLLELVAQMAQAWFSHADRIIFHDPLAAVSIFEPAICEFQSGFVTADPMTGRTEFGVGSGSDRVAVTVDSDRFFERFFATIAALSPERRHEKS